MPDTAICKQIPVFWDIFPSRKKDFSAMAGFQVKAMLDATSIKDREMHRTKTCVASRLKSEPIDLLEDVIRRCDRQLFKNFFLLVRR